MNQAERSIAEEVTIVEQLPTYKDYNPVNWKSSILWAKESYKGVSKIIKDVYNANQVIIIGTRGEEYTPETLGSISTIMQLHTMIEHSDGRWQGIKTWFTDDECIDFSDELLASHIIGHPLTNAPIIIVKGE